MASRPERRPDPGASLLKRVEALEARELVLDDLPIATLMRKLANDWNPDARQLIGPGQIISDMIADGTVAAADLANEVIAPRVTALPGAGSPLLRDGQLITYVADAANGVTWLLKYNASSASAFKWEPNGGSPLLSEVVTDQTTVPALSTTYTDATTVGPSVTVPLAGDYFVVIGCAAQAATREAYMSYAIGATAAVDADSVSVRDDNALTVRVNVSKERRKNGLAAGTALVAKYRVSVNDTAPFFRDRFIRVMPARVG